MSTKRKHTKFFRKAYKRAKLAAKEAIKIAIIEAKRIRRLEEDPVQRDPPGKGHGTHFHEPVLASPRAHTDAQWLLDNNHAGGKC